MDQKATRRSPSQEKREGWVSMPASSHEDNTRGVQAQTQDSVQPLAFLYEGERAMSPPPVTLEKAMDPSLGSQPNTPSAASTGCLSRSSTLNSSSTVQTQDSENTFYSHSSSFSDDTVSVSTSSSLPSLGPHPVDRNPLLKEANFRVFTLPKPLLEQHPVLPYASGVFFSKNHSRFGRINRYLTWPHPQDEEARPDSNQVPPQRKRTFPLEIPRDLTTLEEETESFTCNENADSTMPLSSSLGDPLQSQVTALATDMDHNVLMQEGPPDEAESHNLQSHEDIFGKRRFITPDHWMPGSLNSKHDGLYCELPRNSSAEFLLQRPRKLSRNISIFQERLKERKAIERSRNAVLQHHQSDGEQQDSAETMAFPAASKIVTTEAAMAPERIGRKELQTQAEEIQESLTSSPSPPNKPCGEINRESSWSDSDDNTGCPHEDCSPESTEDEDFAYDELVEGITNLILESSCVGNVEDRGVPVKLYVHNLLERILNHPRSPSESQVLCFPIRSLPTQNNKGPVDAGEPGMHAHGQFGNGGSSGTNKRKSDGAPGHSRNSSYGDQDDFGDDLEELQNHNPQKVKKQKTGKRGSNFSCPFRKRNPIRFNVRDHGSCALHSFADFALLKRHIKTNHQKANNSTSCVRCKEPFPDQAALNCHLTRTNICPIRDPTGDEDPEEGITEEIDRALKVRTKDDNVRAWESLWKLLFPNDSPEHIPGPEHEPPVELDEVQNYCYKEDLLREFIHEETMNGETVMTAHGFRYMVKCFKHLRNHESHKPSKVRLDRDRYFEAMVDRVLSTRPGASQAQQTQPTVVYDPPDGDIQSQWEENGFVDPLSLGIDLGRLYTSQNPYPTFPVYASHLGGNGSQMPAPSMHPSSEDPTHYAADPHHAPTAFQYGAMPPQNGSPCSAAGGSAHRSSGPSSQSRDSGDLTLETQNTQYTQEAALLNHCCRAVEEGGAPCDQHGAAPCSCSCSSCCSTSPGGMMPGHGPGRHAATSPGGHQGSSEHNLYGVGTSSFARPEFQDGSNSDEDLGPIPDIWKK